MPRVYVDADRLRAPSVTTHPFLSGKYVGYDDGPPWIPLPEELEGADDLFETALTADYHELRMITRLYDPEFAYEYRQALIELRNELDQEAAWENEGGLCH
jgi:hypothetical protein